MRIDLCGLMGYAFMPHVFLSFLTPTLTCLFLYCVIINIYSMPAFVKYVEIMVYICVPTQFGSPKILVIGTSGVVFFLGNSEMAEWMIAP